MTSSKLNYASLRSNQRKNKSMHEVKDLLSKNAFQQPHIHHNQSPPFSLEQHIRTQKDLLDQAKFSQSLFEEVSTAEKSAHNPTKSVFGKPREDHLYQHEPKGHHRVKSHLMETYQKEFNKTEDLDRNLGSATFGRLQGNETRELLYQKKDPVYVNRDADDLIEKLMEEHRLAREKEKSLKDSKAGYGSRLNGVGEFKSGRALGDFLNKDGGFSKETMTPDDLRPRQKDLNVHNFEYQTMNTLEKKSATKASTIKSPDQTLEDMASPKGNFAANLNSYIDYFRKTEKGERERRHSKPGNENQHPHHHHHHHHTNERERATHHLEETGEGKHGTKHQIEELNMKMNEVMKINKKLLKEFAGMIQREENQAQRILMLEQEFGSLKKRNRRYREELKHTVHLLEKERIENQNNLLALKRVLSNGINMALDHRANKKQQQHFEGTRDRERGEREREREKHLRFEGTLKNSTLDMSYKKKEKDERKSSEKRPSNKKEESIYAPKSSLFSNDGSGYAGRRTSKEEEYDEEEDEGDKLETSEIDNEELYDQMMHKDELVDRYKKHDVWSPDRRNMTKENLREQKIKEIQEKIAEMMGDQETSKKHEHHPQEKLISQMKHSSLRYTGKFGHDLHGYEQKYPKVQNFFP